VLQAPLCFFQKCIGRRQLGWIFVLIEGDFCVALGSPLPVFYVKKHLGCEKTEAYDIIKTAKAMPNIPRSLDAFECGKSLLGLKTIKNSFKKYIHTARCAMPWSSGGRLPGRRAAASQTSR